MDLRDEVDKKLTEVNTVQLQGPNSTTTYMWDQDNYRWLELHDGPSKRVYVGYQLRDIIIKHPFTTRRKGSILIVTTVDISQRIE